MTTAIVSFAGRDYTLTDEHAACSYGQPVLVGPTGLAYGPDEDVVWAPGYATPARVIAGGLRPLHPIFGDGSSPGVLAMLEKFEGVADRPFFVDRSSESY